jgi:hypothetical protein
MKESFISSNYGQAILKVFSVADSEAIIDSRCTEYGPFLDFPNSTPWGQS